MPSPEVFVNAPETRPEFLLYGKFAVFFPGQGYQFSGMGKAEYEVYDFVREIHHKANKALRYSITDIMFDSKREDELKSLRFGQPAILVDIHSKFAVLKHHYPETARPEAFGGLSFGELCALVESGAVDFSEMLRIVDVRGDSFERSRNGKSSDTGILKITLKPGKDGELSKTQRMLFALGAKQLRKIGLEYGYFYNERTIAMGGTDEQITQALTIMEPFSSYGVVAERAPVAIAFHTSHVSDSIADVREAVFDIPIRIPTIPVMINRTATLTTDPETIRDEIPKHADNAVNLTGSVRKLRKHQLVGPLIEVGSRPIVVVLTKSHGERRIPIRTPDGKITLGFALVPDAA